MSDYTLLSHHSSLTVFNDMCAVIDNTGLDRRRHERKKQWLANRVSVVRKAQKRKKTWQWTQKETEVNHFKYNHLAGPILLSLIRFGLFESMYKGASAFLLVSDTNVTELIVDDGKKFAYIILGHRMPIFHKLIWFFRVLMKSLLHTLVKISQW